MKRTMSDGLEGQGQKIFQSLENVDALGLYGTDSGFDGPCPREEHSGGGHRGD